MAYTKTDWVDGTTPLSELYLDHLEQGVADAHAGLPPSPTGQDGKWLTVAGGAMVWAAAPGGGGGGGLDWEGAWLAPTAYVKGDVVTYGGVVYGAVNDSTGQTPPAANQIPQTFTPTPLVTVLPSSPFDGQEIVLVDSLTAPTYSWRFRYVAAKASNKWLFIGGAPQLAEVIAQESVPSAGSYVAMTTPGPSIVLPVAGDYLVSLGAMASGNPGGTNVYMSYDIGGTAASDNDAMVGFWSNGGNTVAQMRKRKKTGLGAVTLTAKYKVNANTGTLMNRWMEVEPIAVGG